MKYRLYGKTAGQTKWTGFGDYATKTEAKTASGLETIDLRDKGYDGELHWMVRPLPKKKVR